jgi:hypothetical protein
MCLFRSGGLPTLRPVGSRGQRRPKERYFEPLSLTVAVPEAVWQLSSQPFA